MHPLYLENLGRGFEKVKGEFYVVMDSLNLYTSKEIYIMNNLYKYIGEVI